MEKQTILAEKQIIKTKRLLLRPVRLDDAKDMYEYTSNPDVVRYTTMTTATSVKQTYDGIAEFFIANPVGKWGIESLAEERLIGTIDLRLDSNNNAAEIGYALNEKFWGNGFMPEAASVVLKLGFEELKLHRIYAVHDIDNPNSGRVMKKIGMQKEGVLREAAYIKNRYINHCVHSILSTEYFGKNV
ncbi:GNAT family N-acetyltransferase [Pediococcus claussenii]|uniref:Acetyltransferase family protein n=1 Tax=Pediococcus claussenii (strain ATCC BAA-344 / DSM 14800 / JCM 18046 / KCTC 3811 / LMG 21948 / P06) TaxID=701521 RepID=G8PA76_PEDCP|nr:GNAT family N-acetyltransferase [Pediococcus claussenii]AEV94515.1 acetyltransferase family protein [Pediococcus claussenii ATCC BAA-344]ANZ71549.1 acetyltransferase [Pediococcus claussenii]KRN19778.1 hypothetical protein IV79_GL001066 [Pediococcus claussenii]